MSSSIKLHIEQKVGVAAGLVGETPVHLRAAGVSLVLSVDRFGVPFVAHWGKAMSDDDLPGLLATSTPAVMNSSLDIPRTFSIAAGRTSGWSGTPAVSAHTGARVLESFRLVRTDVQDAHVTFTLVEASGVAELEFRYGLDDAGILRADARLRNTSMTDSIDVGAMRIFLPLPGRATEIQDFTGRWTHEHQPQRSQVQDGTWSRASRRGRPGHDASWMTLVGTPGWGFRSGELWASHVAWSGNQETLVERLPEGAGVHRAVVGGGELLDRGEVVLAPGEEYVAPSVFFAWSNAGLDGVTARFHASIRARPEHPRAPRPLLLNTWEAVYFEHDPVKLQELAGIAASVGVERFVLDDGWFHGRRDDHRGLGDWGVDASSWPHGLRTLSDHVRELGMQFGLWFEPEMVNPDSDLARKHPEWILGESPLLEWRHQFVLDFSRTDVRSYIVDRMDEIIGAEGVDFVKWDHNRDLHAAIGPQGQRRAHAHTAGVMQVLAELKRRQPRLEIESCASGGARADLGILRFTDRVWASDSNDPVERQHIQRWTQTLLPPELIGAHVGPAEAHTTRRRTDFSFRALTALFGHAGLEWDLASATADELDAVSAWTALYRELRPLLHNGVTVRGDDVDPGALLHGIVAFDRREAVFAWVRLQTSSTANTSRTALPGLDADTAYHVRVREELGGARRHQVADPAWLVSGLVCTGAVLAEGIPLPVLNPEQGMLLHLTAVDD